MSRGLKFVPFHYMCIPTLRDLDAYTVSLTDILDYKKKLLTVIYIFVAYCIILYIFD